MKTKTVVVNGILAALYIAMSLLIQPLVFNNIQFRVPEMFNHLIIFNKKYFWGIIVGVFFTNLYSPMGVYDLLFGVGQSVIALLCTMYFIRYITTIRLRMVFNTFVFTFTMFLIAIELNLAIGLPFWFAWATTALGELVVMAMGAPVIYALNKRIQFERLV